MGITKRSRQKGKTKLQKGPFVPVNGPNHLNPLCSHSLRHTSLTPSLNISNSTLQRTRQINMKQRSR